MLMRKTTNFISEALPFRAVLFLVPWLLQIVGLLKSDDRVDMGSISESWPGRVEGKEQEEGIAHVKSPR